MAKKGITVWLFSTLTFAAILHLIDATYTLVLNNQIKLLPLYPFIGEELQTITPIIYFLGSTITALTLWGITCAIAFENPVETFLNKILSDAKKQSTVEAQILNEKGEILDVMNETVEMNNTLLAQVKDMTYNIRTEVKEIQPLKENVEKLRKELSHLKREIKKFEENMKQPNKCPTCKKTILPDFKICPYCGENTKLIPETLIKLKDYR